MCKPLEAAIIEALKKEFQYNEEDYQQWVMGVSFRKEAKRVEGSQTFTIRVVVKTSASIYVDAMEMEVDITDGEVNLEEDFFEKTPDLMGSPVKDSITWMLKLGDIIYLQQLNPYEHNVCLDRLIDILYEYSLEETLPEYNLESRNGRNLLSLYQDILEEALSQRVLVEGVEVGIGEYDLKITTEDKIYNINHKASFSELQIIEEIESKIIVPIMENSL